MKPIGIGNIKGPILIVAPHPDDEVLGAGGLIQKVVKARKQVYIVFLTNGDANKETFRSHIRLPVTPTSFRKLGQIRHLEALRADKHLGIPASNLFFLSFPDTVTLQIAQSNNPNRVFRSPTTLFNCANYPFAFRRNAPYNKATAVSLFIRILRKVKPGTILVTHPSDKNPEHRSAPYFLSKALRFTKMSPLILKYLTHYPGWPTFRGYLVPPGKLNSNNVRSLYLTTKEVQKAIHSFRLHRSQYNPRGRLVRLIRKNELFWVD